MTRYETNTVSFYIYLIFFLACSQGTLGVAIYVHPIAESWLSQQRIKQLYARHYHFVEGGSQ